MRDLCKNLLRAYIMEMMHFEGSVLGDQDQEVEYLTKIRSDPANYLSLVPSPIPEYPYGTAYMTGGSLNTPSAVAEEAIEDMLRDRSDRSPSPFLSPSARRTSSPEFGTATAAVPVYQIGEGGPPKTRATPRTPRQGNEAGPYPQSPRSEGARSRTPEETMSRIALAVEQQAQANAKMTEMMTKVIDRLDKGGFSKTPTRLGDKEVQRMRGLACAFQDWRQGIGVYR